MMIFFDIDETLLDQRHAEAAALAELAVRYGPCLPDGPPAALGRRWRAVRQTHLPTFLAGAIGYDEYHRRRVRDLFLDGPALDDGEADARYAAFFAAYHRAWRLFDDVPAALDALADCRLGIVSNGSGHHQRLKLQRTGIFGRFAAIVVSDEVSAAKPAADIFRAACSRAGDRPGDCIHVGDSLRSDARAATAAGLRGIWLNRHGCRGPSDVETIASPAELPGRLLRSVPARAHRPPFPLLPGRR